MPAPQDLKHHIRWDPVFHFTIVPLLVINLIFSIILTVHYGRPGLHLHVWSIVMAVVFLLMAGYSREAALKVQNRVIRLEERTRLAALLTPSALIEVSSLTTDQLIGLRFASDVELPDLARRAIREKLTRQQIKDVIVSWRADNERV